MYREADEAINRGLSLGARVLLGSVAALFGVIMVLFASISPRPFWAYLFAAFCFIISLACFTRGRLRQFLGSIIGSAMFASGVWYLADEALHGRLLSGSRTEPSLWNAISYLLLIGLPGAAYVLKARFGLGPRKGAGERQA